MYMQGSQVEIQTQTHWNLIGRSMTALPLLTLCYRPPVFFSYLILIALSVPQGKFQLGF